MKLSVVLNRRLAAGEAVSGSLEAALLLLLLVVALMAKSSVLLLFKESLWTQLGDIDLRDPLLLEICTNAHALSGHRVKQL